MRKLRALLSYFISCQLLTTCWIMAADVVAKAAGEEHNLDLSSTTRNISGSTVGGSTSINVGGQTTVVDGSSSLTPAEYLAALQSLSPSGQTLTLAVDGSAVGGTFVIPTNIASSQLSSLVVPTGVTGIHDFASAQTLGIVGNFINNGSFYAVSSHPAFDSALINVTNLVNQPGALLTSVLPSGGLAGFSNLISNLDLNIQALNSIANYGTISSSGSLTMAAGNSIINQSVSNIASLAAVRDISLISANIVNTGQITSALANVNMNTTNLLNSGLLSAQTGNLSIQNLVGNVININNVGGLISAQNNLHIGIDNNGTDAVLDVLGGTLTGNAVSLDAGRGFLNVDVENISANVDLSGRYLDLSVSAGTNGLSLGNFASASTVDLSYVGSGNVSMTNPQTGGGSIYVSTTNGSIDINGNINTTPGSGNAGSVYLSAASGMDLNNIITVGASSGNGGDITVISSGDLSLHNLNSSAGANGQDSGVITIIGGSSGNGDVELSNITSNSADGGGLINISASGNIDVSGSLTAIDGTINLSSSSQSINNIDLGGGAINFNPLPGTGTFSLDLAALSASGASSISVGGTSPVSANIVLSSNCNQCFSSATSVSINTAGTYSSGGYSIVLGNGQSYSVNADGGISTGSVSGGSSLSFSTDGALTVDGNLQMNGGTINLAGSSLDLSGSINNPGGSVNILPRGFGTVVLDAGQLSEISTANLNIGNGLGQASVLLLGNADFANVSQSLNFNLGAAFDSSQSTLNLANGTLMSVSAATVSLGPVSGSSGLTVSSQGAGNITGDINLASGLFSFSADSAGGGANLNIGSGLDIQADELSFSSMAGNIVSGGNLNAREGDLSLNAGNSIAILDSSSLAAGNDLSISALGNLSIGSQGGAGVSLRAGSSSLQYSGWMPGGPVAPGQIDTNGDIMIDNFQGGLGQGDINIGSNISMTAFGGRNVAQQGPSGGNIGVLAGADLNVGEGATLVSIGGNLWLSAGDDLSIDNGSRLGSVSVVNAGQGNSSSNTGGAIGILAGAPSTDMAALLNNLASRRSQTNQFTAPTDGSFSTDTNDITLSGGSVMQVIFPQGGAKGISNSSFDIAGGVLYLDPPDPGNTVTITGVQFGTAGQNIGNSVTIPNLPTGGGTGGTVGGGTGTTIPPVLGGNNGGTFGGTGNGAGVGTGAAAGALLAGTGGSVSASDALLSGGIRTNSNNNGSIGGVTGPLSLSASGVPSDTVDGDDRTARQGMRPAIFCSTPVQLKPTDKIDEDGWIVASSSCQPFTFEAKDGSLIVGSGPAKFAPTADRTLLLKEGKLLVVTSDRMHIVRTPLASVTVPVNTATIIEFRPEGVSRIANLAGGKASVTVSRNEETIIVSTAPGEQLILADAEVKDADVQSFAYLNVQHKPLSSWGVQMSGLRGNKFVFSRQEMAIREPLLHCSMGCINESQMRRLEQILQSMNDDQSVILKSMSPERRRPLVGGPIAQRRAPSPLVTSFGGGTYSPVGFSDQSIDYDNQAVTMSTLGASTATIRYTDAPQLVMQSPGVLELQSGEILLSTHKPTVVHSNDCSIKLEAGTVAVVSCEAKILKVRNLCERSRTGICASAPDNRCIGLQVGHELIVGPKGMSLSRAFKGDLVARRRMTSYDSAYKKSFVSAEYSITSLLQNSPLLSQLIHSPDSNDQILARRIMKVAVCLSVVTQGHGNYSMSND